jgi:hypothetical protein
MTIFEKLLAEGLRRLRPDALEPSPPEVLAMVKSFSFGLDKKSEQGGLSMGVSIRS